MFELERKYFARHQRNLKRKYPDCFVVIKAKRLLGAYATLHDAISAGTCAYPSAAFLATHVNGLDWDVGNTVRIFDRVDPLHSCLLAAGEK